MPTLDQQRQLEERIVIRIQRARIVRNRTHVCIHGAIIIGSVILFVPALRYVGVEASQSGFYEYLSLIISDGTYLASSWKDITISILDSAPIIGATASLGILLILANSLQRAVRYTSPLRMSSYAYKQ